MSKRFKFQPKPVCKAVGVLAALLAASTSLHAGAGFVDATAPDGVTTFRLQTFFAYSPSGLRQTPVPEAQFVVTNGQPDNTGAALRKFVDPLPLPGEANAKLMKDGVTAKYIPVAVASKWRNPQGKLTGDDYYEIAVIEYADRFHSDLKKPTLLRGYVQIDHEASNGRAPLAGSKSFPLTYPTGEPIMIAATDVNGKIVKDAAGAVVKVPALAVDQPHFLGPVIVATKDVPTRLKFLNLLPVGRVEYNADGSVKSRNGDLFLPIDKMIMGAGFGPDGMTEYTQNRATVHLHGGDTPWISDGTPHQWITPAGEADLNAPHGSLAKEFASDPARDPALLPEFLRGTSAQNVPDMNDPGEGAWTLYFPNAQSARFLWYHDHTVGATRLNVYAGMAAGYLLTDAEEQAMINEGALPPAARTIPLVMQDRTFVPDDIELQDGLWDTQHWGAPGDSWFPHVYETVQDPNQQDNTNAVGRWHYGPYFWPVFPALYPLPSGAYGDVTTTPEAWHDTAVVNGVAYPTLEVDPTTYRFRILNGSNDRMMTFNLFVATDNPVLGDGTQLAGNTGNFTEVDMVPAAPALPENACAPGQTRPSPLFVAGVGGALTPKLNAQGKQMYCQPELWPVDGRIGGMPDPKDVGPALHQIASEGGWLPSVHTIEPNPITYILDKGRINVFNVNTPSLFMAPAERADVVVDFSQYAGKTLIVYNDSSAPVPAGDPRNDVFTGVGDQSGSGGAEDTKPGFGPNIRTMMQIKVKPLPAGAAPAPFDPVASGLKARIEQAYLKTQERPVVAQPAYQGFDANWANLTGDQSYARIQTGSLKEPVFKYTPGTPNTSINSVTLLNRGGGYVAAPAVTIAPPGGLNPTPGGRAAQAVATLQLDKINVTAGGAGYTTAPTVTIVGGGGNGATAEAKLGANQVNIASGGAGYLAAPTVNFTAPPVGGRRATGTATVVGGKVTGVTINDPGTGYVAPPMISFTPVNGGSGARATVTGTVTEVRILAADPQNPGSAGGGGFVNLDPAAAVNPFQINFVGGGGAGAAATATGKVFDITLAYAGQGYAANEVPVITVAPPAFGVTATAQSDLAGGGVAQGSILVKPKAIQELFDATYGRLNATLGVELPFTSAMTQTTIPLGYIDEPTENFGDNETQLWKITHNGVDTHPVHFHLLNVQLINRVDWAGIIMPPAPNELGWKETVKMSPLEDVIVAVRAKKPKLDGFSLPLSVRAMDPTQPLGSPFGFTQIDPTTGTPKTVVNDLMNYGWEYVWHCHILGHEENDFMRPVIFNPNELQPLAPTAISAVLNADGNVDVTWTDATPAGTAQAAPAVLDTAKGEVGFRVQRGPVGTGVFEDLTPDLRSVVGLNGQLNTLANATAYVDTTFANLKSVGGASPAPATPNLPTTGALTPASVTVSWSMPVDLPANGKTVGFKVLRADVDAAGAVGAFSPLMANPLPANVFSYVDNTAQTGFKYQYQVMALASGGDAVVYRVVAVNPAGETVSAESNTVTVTAGAVPPSSTSAASATASVPMVAPTRLGSTITALVAPAIGYNLNFAWNASQNAVSYSVRTRVGTTPNNGVWSAWANQAGTAIDVAPVPVNRFVTVEVRAVSAAGVVSATLSSGAMQVAIPAVPNALTVTGAATDALTFGWAARANAASYTVEYSTTSNFAAGTVTSVPNVQTNSLTVNGLLPNTRYYFHVKAINSVGASAFSANGNGWTLANPVGVAPTWATAGVTAGTQLKLNWQAPVGGASSYVVQLSADGGATWANASTSAQNPATPTGVIVRNLLGVTAYQFRVLARNGANVAAAPSPVTSVTTLLATPSAITAAAGVSGGTVTAGLNFTGNNNRAIAYQYRWANSSITGANAIGPIDGVLSGQQTLVGGAPRTVYLQVRAVNGATVSPWVPNLSPISQTGGQPVQAR